MLCTILKLDNQRWPSGFFGKKSELKLCHEFLGSKSIEMSLRMKGYYI